MGARGRAGRLNKSRMKKPDTTMINELLGMPEAGKRVGCSTDAILERLKTANVPMIRVNGRAWAVWASDLEALTSQPPRRRGRPRKAQAQGAAFATT